MQFWMRNTRRLFYTNKTPKAEDICVASHRFEIALTQASPIHSTNVFSNCMLCPILVMVLIRNLDNLQDVHMVLPQR